MRSGILSTSLAVVVGGGLMLASGRPTQSAEQSDQVLRSRKGTPLAEIIKADRRIKPGDTDVFVEKDQFPGLTVEPPRGTGQLEWMTSLAPCVLVVRISSMEPALRAERDWITTSVTAEVEAVIKQPTTSPVAVEPRIKFVQDGGTMTIEGRRVHAVLSWTEGFDVGQRYLIFTHYAVNPDGWVVGADTAYRIDERERLDPLGFQRAPSTSAARSEEGVTLAAAVARIRAAIKTSADDPRRRVTANGAAPIGAEPTSVTRVLGRAPIGAVRGQDPPATMR